MDAALDCWKTLDGVIDACNELLDMWCELEVGKS